MRVLAVFLAMTFFRILSDVGLADGRLAVGEEDDGEGAAFVVGAHVQGRGQGVVDGGAAGRFQAFDPLLGLLDVARWSAWSSCRGTC